MTGKIFLCTIFCRINEAFCDRVHFQFLETFRDRQVRVWSMHLFKALYLEKIAFIIWFFHVCWRGIVPIFKMIPKATSCFMAEKIALDEPLFCTKKSMGSDSVVWILKGNKLKFFYNYMFALFQNDFKKNSCKAASLQVSLWSSPGSPVPPASKTGLLW